MILFITRVMEQLIQMYEFQSLFISRLVLTVYIINITQVLGGNIIGSDVIIVDDFVGKFTNHLIILVLCKHINIHIDTASKLSVLCRRLKRSGAKRVFVCASHGLFSSNSKC